MARDPSDPMPCVAGAALTRLVPESTSDCVAYDAPAFEILPDGARIDGIPSTPSADSGSSSTRNKYSRAPLFWSFDATLPHGNCYPG
jgi:hypothetical protein